MSPQAFSSTAAPRLHAYANALLTAVNVPAAAPNGPTPRTTKRGTTILNYAEDGWEDEDLDELDGVRRPTGLRSLRRDVNGPAGSAPAERRCKETRQPVKVQGIWRKWMNMYPGQRDMHCYAPAVLPVVLIPIRLDHEIAAFTPDRAWPTPPNARDNGVDVTLPAYNPPDPVGPFHLRDFFCWNLFEAQTTLEEFAWQFVAELDLPDRETMTQTIVAQIRQQLEEWAPVALHPLFFDATQFHARTIPASAFLEDDAAIRTQAGADRPPTDPGAAAPTNGDDPHHPPGGRLSESEQEQQTSLQKADLDDAYRCIISISVNLSNRVYSDKFEWNLLYPAGKAEEHARLTCQDISLHGEWLGAIGHAINEQVLKIKKDVIENGGLMPAAVGLGNMAYDGREAGLRFDPEHLGEEWAPRLEVLTKEEMEKREGDRERQNRRVRRETARFSSATGFGMGGYGYFPDAGLGNVNANVAVATGIGLEPAPEAALGRGERNKKRRRFRSPSPPGYPRTPGGLDTPEVGAGAGGSSGFLPDCPAGPKTLCFPCHFLYETEGKLPAVMRNLHLIERPPPEQRGK
ncbi:MAG: Chromatin structure remodeling complex protein sfh1 [Phylliscum demangeonii]|nr:MAG: Chromatin structure remodeling complex protein sfh1 [Phylliscum demangeonii]